MINLSRYRADGRSFSSSSCRLKAVNITIAVFVIYTPAVAGQGCREGRGRKLSAMASCFSLVVLNEVTNLEVLFAILSECLMN